MVLSVGSLDKLSSWRQLTRCILSLKSIRSRCNSLPTSGHGALIPSDVLCTVYTRCALLQVYFVVTRLLGHHAAAAAAAGNTAVFSAFCVTISSSIYNCSDRRLMFAGHRVYRPSISRCREPVLSALLLLLGGVEQNPGPTTAGAAGTLKPVVALRLGVLNARSAVHNATLFKNAIAES